MIIKLDFAHLTYYTWPIDSSKIVPLRQSLKEGENAEISCLSSKRTRWTLNDNPLPNNIEIIPTPVGGKVTMTIKMIQVSNKGMYECEGIDSDGKLFYVGSLMIIRGMLLILWLHNRLNSKLLVLLNM